MLLLALAPHLLAADPPAGPAEEARAPGVDKALGGVGTLSGCRDPNVDVFGDAATLPVCEPRPEPVPRARLVSLDGSPEAGDVLGGRFTDFSTCTRDPAIHAGSFEIEWSVAGGRAKDAKATENTSGSKELATCMLALLRARRLAMPDGGPYSWSWRVEPLAPPASSPR